jgi:hypothetical protein
MALDYSQNLKAKLGSDTTVASYVASRIHQNRVPTPEETKLDYIWLRRATHQYTRTLDEAAGTAPLSVLYDVECCSRDLNRSAVLADAVRNLFPFSGTFGDSTVKGAFANDQSEDYEPISTSASVGVHVQTIQVEICP